VTVTWARFAWYAGSWHFCGFAGDTDGAREFEDACAATGRPCVVLALSHAGEPLAIEAPRPRFRRSEKVAVNGELL
jgi:hypothetical protein